jgi:competence protein ComEA
LAQVPGLGEVLARRIVDYRTAHGPWQDVRDVQKVRGIGPKIFASIRPYLVLASTGDAPVAHP